MFKVVVKFHGSDQLLQLFFNDGVRAEKVAAGIMPVRGIGATVVAAQTIADEYGQKLFFDSESVAAVFLMDLERAATASGREAMINAREQARVNAQAQRDPAMMMLQPQVGPGLTRLG